MSSHARLASFLACAAIVAPAAPAAPPALPCEVFETHVLRSPEVVGEQSFGWSVAIAGDVVVVGAPHIAEYRGAAMVFRRGDGPPVLEAVLTPEVPSERPWFGIAVATDGTTIVVGAAYDTVDGNRYGAAHVYRRDDGRWTHTARVAARDARNRHNFGYRVAVEGDLIAVSAPWSDDGGEGTGAVYVYRRVKDTWREEAKLQSEDRPPMTYFGKAIDLDADRLAVGVGEDNQTGYGAAYVFAHDGAAWTQEARLVVPDPERSLQLGRSVAIEDRVLVAGANDNEQGARAGAAYVFVRTGTGWRLDERIVPSDGCARDDFGRDVALDGGTLLVSARSWPGGGRRGAAYFFVRAPGLYWTEVSKLIASDGAYPDTLGVSIGLSGGVAVAGAPYRDSLAGAAFLFDAACPPCIGDLDGDGLVGFEDLFALLAAWGPGGEKCPEDLDVDGRVGFEDLVIVLAAWGPCE